MDLKTFLLARITEDEATARAAIAKAAPDEWENPTSWGNFYAEEIAFWDRATPARVLAECAAKRAIIKQHEEWPVLVEQRPEFANRVEGVDSVAFQMSQNIVWLTEREYVKKFGAEPPTAPMIRHLAAVYADHPDYQKEWAPSS